MNAQTRCLGVDGGATKTTWVVCSGGPGRWVVEAEGRLGPGNLRLLGPAGVTDLLRALPGGVTHAGVFLAGCASADDRRVLRAAAETRWPDARVAVGSDRDSAFAAAFGSGDGIAVIAGTGSAVTGRKGDRTDHAGGWGHLLGDRGGGYDLVIRVLRAVLADYDTDRRISPLARDLLAALGLNALADLTVWAQSAHKNDLARLTPVIFAHVPAVRGFLADGARALAELTAAVARRLALGHAEVALFGGLFFHQKVYRELFAEALADFVAGASVRLCEDSPAVGAARLALDAPLENILPSRLVVESTLAAAVTEQANPRSADLDRLDARALVDLFVREERCVEDALAGAAPALAEAVETTASALAAGGRLFYLGAGTSGRLGVLDASEMPPTFGVPPTLVQGLIAGGPDAVFRSIEGAEDDRSAGVQAVRDRGVTDRDVVCGLTASGRTPFVLAALAEARTLGARTILITCNPARPPVEVDVAVDLATGPEIVTGSTRLKAGTATKVALNILSTGAMVRLGRVQGNAMSCLQATNAKLRARAERLVAERLGISASEARQRLEWANWNISGALVTQNPAADASLAAQPDR